VRPAWSLPARARDLTSGPAARTAEPLRDEIDALRGRIEARPSRSPASNPPFFRPRPLPLLLGRKSGQSTYTTRFLRDFQLRALCVICVAAPHAGRAAEYAGKGDYNQALAAQTVMVVSWPCRQLQENRQANRDMAPRGGGRIRTRAATTAP